jgi:hypothetical protein
MVTADRRHEALQECLVLGRVELLEIIVGDDDAVGLLGRQDHVLVSAGEHDGDDGYLVQHAGGSPLPVE